MMGRKWVARRYCKGDEELILQLRKVIRGQTHTKEYWRWRYVDNPGGPAIIWLAVVDGIAVGHSAMIPTTLKVGSSVIAAGLSVDAWTHPDFRHQGIFATLHGKVIEDAANQGIKFAYAFPNKFSYPGHIKLGYSCLFWVPSMRKVVNWGPILKRRIRIPGIERVGDIFSKVGDLRPRLPASPDMKLKNISYFDERFDEFCLRVSQHYSVMVFRDSRYLNRRYVDNPRYDYRIYMAERGSEILGYVILNCIESDIVRGHIVDVLALPDEQSPFSVLVEKSVEDLRSRGVGTIHCWALENTPYYKALMSRGFHRRRADAVRFCGQVLGEAAPEVIRYSENWWLSPGDYDL